MYCGHVVLLTYGLMCSCILRRVPGQKAIQKACWTEWTAGATLAAVRICLFPKLFRLERTLLNIRKKKQFFLYTLFQKSDAKIEITVTTTNLIRIKYPLSSFNFRLSGADVANFNKIHCIVFEQQLFKKLNSKTEVSNMEKSPYQFVHNTISYSLCSKWLPFT